MRYITPNPSNQESAGQTLEVFSTTICGLLRTGEIRFGTFFKTLDNLRFMSYDCLIAGMV